MKKYLLRPFRDDDLHSLVRNANNLNIAKYLTGRFPHPYTEKDGASFIRFATKDDPVQIQAIDVSGEVIGSVGIHPQSDIYCKSAELGYWIAEPYWGQGIISSVIGEVVDYGFSTFDIERIYARTFSNNIPSQRVLIKNGFIREGTLRKAVFKYGEFFDEIIYAMVRDIDWEKG